jgi:hypothetical protein
VWFLRAYDPDTDELESEFALPAEFVRPETVGPSAASSLSTPLSRFLAHRLSTRYGLPIPADARIAFSLDFEGEPR